MGEREGEGLWIGSMISLHSHSTYQYLLQDKGVVSFVCIMPPLGRRYHYITNEHCHIAMHLKLSNTNSIGHISLCDPEIWRQNDRIPITPLLKGQDTGTLAGAGVRQRTLCKMTGYE